MHCSFGLSFYFIGALVVSGTIAVCAQSQTLDEKVLNTFFRNIIDSLTRTGNGFDPIFNPANSYVEVLHRGIPINPNEFNNLISVQNLNGSQTQSELFSRLVNSNGAVSDIESMYTFIVNSSRFPVDQDPTRARMYQRAWSFLYENQSRTDENTGVVTSQIVKTPIYSMYQQKQDLYVKALAAYRSAQASFDLTKPADQRQWFIEEALLSADVRTAYNAFRSIASDVEDALSALNAASASLAATVISLCKTILATSAIDSTATVSQTANPKYHRSYADPWNWATDDQYYLSFSVTTEEEHVSSSASFNSWMASSGAFPGFFSSDITLADNNNNTTNQMHSNATRIQINGKLTLVHIDRPWILNSLFKTGGWSLNGFASGSVSHGDGNVNTVPPLLLPSYPTHLIVLKNASIQADWTNDDLEFLRTHSNDRAFSFGPIALNSDDYQLQVKTVNLPGGGSSNLIAISGLQVLGYVNGIVSFSPQVDDPNASTPSTTITPTSECALCL